MTEDKWKQMYMQFQMLQQQIEQLTEHVEMLNQQIAELDISVNAIKQIKETKVDNEILAPVANGIFIKAKLQDNQKLIVNVGADTTVEKTVDQVVELLEKQQKSVTNKLVEAESVLQNLQSQAMQIYDAVEE